MVHRHSIMEQLLMADEEQVLSSEEDKYVGKDKMDKQIYLMI